MITYQDFSSVVECVNDSLTGAVTRILGTWRSSFVFTSMGTGSIPGPEPPLNQLGLP